MKYKEIKNTKIECENLTALEVSKYIIYRCNLVGIEINNLFLQGFLYNIQKTHLKKYNRIVFKENIYTTETFPRPNIKSVYDNYCHYAALPITYIDKEEYKEAEKKITKEINNTIIDVTTDYIIYWIKHDIFEYIDKIVKAEPYSLTYEMYGSNKIIPYEVIRRSLYN